MQQKHIIKLTATIALACAVASCCNYPSSAKASYVRCIDGDTFVADIYYWPMIVGKKMPVRIYGIDCPEKRDKRPAVKKLSKEALRYSRERLKNAQAIELRNIKRGKYFRLLADVYVDGDNLADELIKRGYAKPYYGKRKPKWTLEEINYKNGGKQK